MPTRPNDLLSYLKHMPTRDNDLLSYFSTSSTCQLDTMIFEGVGMLTFPNSEFYESTVKHPIHKTVLGPLTPPNLGVPVGAFEAAPWRSPGKEVGLGFKGVEHA